MKAMAWKLDVKQNVYPSMCITRKHVRMHSLHIKYRSNDLTSSAHREAMFSFPLYTTLWRTQSKCAI